MGFDVAVHQARAVNDVQVLEELLHRGLRHRQLHRRVAAHVILPAQHAARDARGIVGLRHELRQGAVPLKTRVGKGKTKKDERPLVS